MKRSRPALMMLSAVLIAAASFAQESLPDVFNRMKSEFGKGEYRQSLADVEVLDSLTQKAGFEADRAKLAAPISFYRAASLAGLGRRDDAREEFINFLMLSPNASITSASFPKPVVDAFQQAQKIAAGRNNTLAVSYAAFAMPAGWKLPSDSMWALSPVRYLLSNEEKKAYADMTAESERDAFVTNFWKEFDPTPGTPGNEFRSEFERRVAFADQTFTTPKVAGRESDRALVFTFLGPPTYAGKSAISAGDDAISSLRRGAPGGSPSYDIENPDRLGMRESWYYRAARLPARVPFKEVRFDFLTKEGYGESVMQKDPNILQTLGVATDTARKDKKLN